MFTFTSVKETTDYHSCTVTSWYHDLFMFFSLLLFFINSCHTQRSHFKIVYNQKTASQHSLCKWADLIQNEEQDFLVENIDVCNFQHRYTILTTNVKLSFELKTCFALVFALQWSLVIHVASFNLFIALWVNPLNELST